jgi:hypothetical protein
LSNLNLPFPRNRPFGNIIKPKYKLGDGEGDYCRCNGTTYLEIERLLIAVVVGEDDLAGAGRRQAADKIKGMLAAKALHYLVTYRTVRPGTGRLPVSS